MPAETLEEGMEEREILAPGCPAGLMVDKRTSDLERNVLLGPIGEALGSPPGWLDDLDPSVAINTILTATALLPPERLEEALAAWDGLEVADEWLL